MELTPELLTAAGGFVLSVGGAIGYAIRWAVAVAREEAALTRDGHAKQTQALIDAQKARDTVQIELAKQREEIVERRLTAVTEGFKQGLDDVRRSGETIVAMHQDYKQAHADLRQAFEDLRKWQSG